jgi:predicted helicase
LISGTLQKSALSRQFPLVRATYSRHDFQRVGAVKYRNKIHANVIVPLAYSIAAINIEAVYHGHSSR